MTEIKDKNLQELPQYHFNRGDFVKTFHSVFEVDQIEDILADCTSGRQTAGFSLFRDEDEFYILHKDSGTFINWYKHIGRTNTCNKPGLTLIGFREFLELLRADLFTERV